MIYFAIGALGTILWLCYEVSRAPFLEVEEDVEDPTTTCWHDDEHYPDSKI